MNEEKSSLVRGHYLSIWFSEWQRHEGENEHEAVSDLNDAVAAAPKAETRLESLSPYITLKAG